MPKRVKFRKNHLVWPKRKASRGTEINFGDYGLKALNSGWISDRQIEAARITLTRSMGQGGKIWIRIFPHQSLTKKPAETRMGKGKGDPEKWIVPVSAGKILFELGGTSLEVARVSMGLAADKLSVRTIFLTRQD